MVLTHTIETDGRRPHNRNRWPYNSRATAFCHAWPILLFVLQTALPVNSVSVTTPAKKIKKFCTTLGISGAKSFIFRNLGGLAPPPSPYVEPPLSSTRGDFAVICTDLKFGNHAFSVS